MSGILIDPRVSMTHLALLPAWGLVADQHPHEGSDILQ